MAKKTFRLLEQGAASGYAGFADLEEGAEFEHDFYNADTGLNSEQAVIAAGWVEPVEDKPKKKES